MTSPFKLGETYPMRGGGERKVIYIGERFMIVIDGYEYPARRYLDGKEMREADSPFDLMPRTKQVTRWVAIPDPLYGFANEEEARRCVPGALTYHPVTFTVPDDGSEDS